jgi:hypothetical protein
MCLLGSTPSTILVYSQGIPTLVISACAADDVVAISGFGIFLGIAFNSDAGLAQQLMHGPIEVPRPAATTQ